MESLIDRVHDLAEKGAQSLGALVEALTGGDVDDATLASLALDDPRHPYGRRVIFDGEHLEGMVATWTRAFACAPHDHGGSVGVVRVLRGRARHRIWRLHGEDLSCVVEEEVPAGGVIACGPNVVHSLVDAGADDRLMTLHLYTAPIARMVVYDRATRSTFVVEGRCGAWIPVDDRSLVRCYLDGFRARSTLSLD